MLKYANFRLAGPPQQPVLSLAAVTSSSVQVTWRTGHNGGSRIQGFGLYRRREHAPWAREALGPGSRAYVATGLRCGASYTFYVRAVNAIGEGAPSETVTTKTIGSRE